MTINIDILNLLMPNILTVLAQLCASGLLFFLLYYLAYKPVKKIMDQRAEFEQNKLIEAQKLKDSNQATFNQAETIIEKAKEHAQEIVDSANENAKQIENEILLDAKQKANKLLKDADYKIEAERVKMLNENKHKIVDMVINTNKKLINESVNKDDISNDIDHFIKELENNE